MEVRLPLPPQKWGDSLRKTIQKRTTCPGAWAVCGMNTSGIRISATFLRLKRLGVRQVVAHLILGKPKRDLHEALTFPHGTLLGGAANANLPVLAAFTVQFIWSDRFTTKQTVSLIQ